MIWYRHAQKQKVIHSCTRPSLTWAIRHNYHLFHSINFAVYSNAERNGRLSTSSRPNIERWMIDKLPITLYFPRLSMEHCSTMLWPATTVTLTRGTSKLGSCVIPVYMPSQHIDAQWLTVITNRHTYTDRPRYVDNNKPHLMLIIITLIRENCLTKRNRTGSTYC